MYNNKRNFCIPEIELKIKNDEVSRKKYIAKENDI